MIKQMVKIRFTQWRRRVWNQAMTPVIPNRGSQAPSEAHLEPESGVKLGRAGKSGGKKKQVRMCRYRWTLLYSTAFQPLMYSLVR